MGPPVLGPSALEDMLAEKLERHRDREEQNKLSVKVLVMQPILRFLQLLCENHNRYLQVSFSNWKWLGTILNLYFLIIVLWHNSPLMTKALPADIGIKWDHQNDSPSHKVRNFVTNIPLLKYLMLGGHKSQELFKNFSSTGIELVSHLLVQFKNIMFKPQFHMG